MYKRQVAVDALDLLRQQGMELKTVVLTAKEKLCVCEKPECDPDHCPRAKGHFDRINQAVYELSLIHILSMMKHFECTNRFR